MSTENIAIILSVIFVFESLPKIELRVVPVKYIIQDDQNTMLRDFSQIQ